MRISDWSSDVCSSDLKVPRHLLAGDEGGMERQRARCRACRAACAARDRAGQLRCASVQRRTRHDARTCAAPVDLSPALAGRRNGGRSEEHTSELQSLMRISYAVFCLKQNKNKIIAKQQTLNIRTTLKEQVTM